MSPVDEAEMLYAQWRMRMEEAGADHDLLWAVMGSVEAQSAAFDNIIERSKDE